MFKRIFVGLALACLLSVVLGAADAMAQVPFVFVSAADAPIPDQSIFVGGAAPRAPSQVIVLFDSFAVGYVKAWGEPAWSAQHETAASIAAGAKVKRNGSFHVCVFADGSKSVSPSVYAKSGYDLGHQTEDAGRVDRPPTFGTCNMSPQRPNLNRVIWAGIEEAVRNLAAADGDLYVVTGPEISPSAQRLGGLVSVPVKSWKAVDDVKAGAAAYVCTNTDTPVCTTESIDALAAEIGFDPFPALPDSVKAVAIKLPEPTKGGSLAN